MIPYHNSAQLIASLSIVPELSLSAKGRRFSNFSVQTAYLTETGTPVVDYINITCYDDDAEMVVRDCRVGDLLFVYGSLMMDHWEGKNGEHKSKITLVAKSVQRLADGDGRLPVESDYDASTLPMKAYRKKGEHAILSSYMIDEYPNRTPDRARFPQPLSDGTWAPPIGDPNSATQIFYSQRPDVANNLRTRSIPDNDADAQFAKTIVTENLPVIMVSGVRTVFLPDNRYMTEEEYIKRVESQRSRLLSMPVEQRLRVLDIAARIYGIKIIDDGNVINGEPLPPVTTADEVNEALRLSADIQEYHNKDGRQNETR